VVVVVVAGLCEVGRPALRRRSDEEEEHEEDEAEDTAAAGDMREPERLVAESPSLSPDLGGMCDIKSYH
jgi:hypothetical protein